MNSCKNSDHEITAEIEALQEAKDLPKVETKIWSYLEDNPKSDGGVLFAKLAQKALALSSSLNAENYYIYAVREFPDSKVRYQNMYALSFLYKDHLQDDYAANLICCAMKQSENTESKQKGTSCCTGEDTSSEPKMEQLRSGVFNQETGIIDLQTAKKYIRSSKALALVRPGEKIAADHLNEAAKIAKATKDPMTAIELFHWLSDHFSNTDYGAKSLFLIAFTYENDLNDVENARKYYNLFIEEYPKDEFVEDAKLLLQNLGKDPEEIIRQFEKETQQTEQ
jgi:tetratricopeptide (TPR) repeat protein